MRFISIIMVCKLQSSVAPKPIRGVSSR